MPNAPYIGVVIWSDDGETILHHAVWQADDRALAMTRSEYFEAYVVPALTAIEKRTGKKLMPGDGSEGPQ